MGAQPSDRLKAWFEHFSVNSICRSPCWLCTFAAALARKNARKTAFHITGLCAHAFWAQRITYWCWHGVTCTLVSTTNPSKSGHRANMQTSVLSAAPCPALDTHGATSRAICVSKRSWPFLQTATIAVR